MVWNYWKRVARASFAATWQAIHDNPAKTAVGVLVSISPLCLALIFGTSTHDAVMGIVSSIFATALIGSFTFLFYLAVTAATYDATAEKRIAALQAKQDTAELLPRLAELVAEGHRLINDANGRRLSPRQWVRAVYDWRFKVRQSSEIFSAALADWPPRNKWEDKGDTILLQAKIGGALSALEQFHSKLEAKFMKS